MYKIIHFQNLWISVCCFDELCYIGMHFSLLQAAFGLAAESAINFNGEARGESWT